MFFDMKFVDQVQVITQTVTAVIAFVMAFLAYKTYLGPPVQIQEVEPETASDESADEELNEILVFKTSKQETWLSVLPQGLHCQIKDSREGKGGPQWTLSKTQAKDMLGSSSFHVNPGYKVRTGTFTLGREGTGYILKFYFRNQTICLVYLNSFLRMEIANKANAVGNYYYLLLNYLLYKDKVWGRFLFL